MGRTASGNITPMSFVILDTGNVGQVALATGTTVPLYGISGSSVRFAPLAPLDDGYHAIAGQDCVVFGTNDATTPMPNLQLGGTVTIGQLLTSDGSGHGIAATVDTGQYVGARAEASGVSGQYIPVTVFPSYVFGS
jgi:hypothetical protein